VAPATPALSLQLHKTGKPCCGRQVEDEFFYLTVVCVKMRHPEMNKVCMLNPQKLYQQAQYEGVQMHQWDPWVKRQLDEQVLDQLYGKRKEGTNFKVRRPNNGKDCTIF